MIHTYHNLKIELTKHSFNAWRPDFYYAGNLDELDDYIIEEVIFDGVFSSRDQLVYKNRLNLFRELCLTNFNNQNSNLYLFVFENIIEYKTKLRSRKGFVDKKVMSNEFIENEVTVYEDMSIFITLCKIIDFNTYLFDLFLNDKNCFIVCTDENLFTEKSIIEMYNCLIKSKNTIDINYLNLMKRFCKRNSFIYKVGGDNGEEYWSFQTLKKR